MGSVENNYKSHYNHKRTKDFEAGIAFASIDTFALVGMTSSLRRNVASGEDQAVCNKLDTCHVCSSPLILVPL